MALAISTVALSVIVTAGVVLGVVWLVRQLLLNRQLAKSLRDKHK